MLHMCVIMSYNHILGVCVYVHSYVPVNMSIQQIVITTIYRGRSFQLATDQQPEV